MQFAQVVVFVCLMVANSMAYLWDLGPNRDCSYAGGKVGFEQDTILCIGWTSAGTGANAGHEVVVKSPKYWTAVVNGKPTICCGQTKPEKPSWF